MALSFSAAMHAFQPRLPLAVAMSGGADSSALLVACVTAWPGQVHAIHVNHALQPAARDFETACRNLCERMGAPLEVERVDARPSPGESPEDAARKARYDGLQRAARAAGLATVALAHHADDQVESILLALSRGAGLPGLAGMRAAWERDGIAYARPLLDVPRAELRKMLRSHAATWVEDPSNTDEHFTRNRIRARLMPALEEAFPQFRDTFARSARHSAQAQALLDEVAAGDLAGAGNPPRIDVLRAHGRARQANLLRHWLRTTHGEQPSAAQLDELLDQLAACATRGHRIHIKVARGFVRRDGDHLQFGPG